METRVKQFLIDEKSRIFPERISDKRQEEIIHLCIDRFKTDFSRVGMYRWLYTTHMNVETKSLYEKKSKVPRLEFKMWVRESLPDIKQPNVLFDDIVFAYEIVIYREHNEWQERQVLKLESPGTSQLK